MIENIKVQRSSLVNWASLKQHVPLLGLIGYPCQPNLGPKRRALEFPLLFSLSWSPTSKAREYSFYRDGNLVCKG